MGNFLKHSVIFKLILIFVSFILLIELVMVYSAFQNIKKVVMEETNTTAYHSLQRTATSLEQLLSSMMMLTKSFSSDEAFLAALSNTDTNPEIQYQNQQIINNRLDATAEEIPGFSVYCCVVSSSGSIYCSYSVETWEYYKDLSHQHLASWNKIQSDTFIYNDKNYLPVLHNSETGALLTFASPLTDPRTFQKKGIIVMSVPHSNVEKMLSSLATLPESRMLLVDDALTPVSTWNVGEDLSETLEALNPSQKDQSYFYVIGGQNYLVNHLALEGMDLQLFELLPYNLIFYKLEQIRSKLFLVVFLSFCVLLCISVCLAVFSTRSLRQLNRNMRSVAEGNLNLEMKLKTQDEIGSLAITFNTMIRRIRNLLEEQKIHDEKLRQLEIESLQQQIRPHFLLNTINSIRWMAIMSQADNVQEMLGSLSNLLKTSIYTSERYHTLGNELDNLADYVKLQKIRYNGLFQVEFHINQDFYSCMIPKMTLQPIVENALMHGLDMNSSESTIKVDSNLDINDLILIIYDNGRGIEPQQLEQLNRNLNGQESDKIGIGLLNVHQRLQYTYGPSYGIHIISQPERGTAVELRLPFRFTIPEEVQNDKNSYS